MGLVARCTVAILADCATAAAPTLEPTEGDGLAVADGIGLGEGVAVGVAVGLGLALADGAGVAEPLGIGVPGGQDAERAGLAEPDPDTDGAPDCELPGAGPPEWPPCCVPASLEREFALLGKISTDASIATYMPAATMNMTAIAATGRSHASVRERCQPCACAGPIRSQTGRMRAPIR